MIRQKWGTESDRSIIYREERKQQAKVQGAVSLFKTTHINFILLKEQRAVYSVGLAAFWKILADLFGQIGIRKWIKK